MGNIRINSEIGKLQKVVIHRPGLEVEQMTPRTAENLLYDDILDISTAINEHDELSGVLKMHCKVLEVQDLLEDVLKDEEARKDLLKRLIEKMGASTSLMEDLMKADYRSLAHKLITGVKQKKDTLEKYLSKVEFDLPPLPNLFYTRDSAIVINEYIVTGSMANKIRASESIIMEFLFTHHPDIMTDGFYFDGYVETDKELFVEGGDVLVLREDVLAIGLSERTNASAIDFLSSKFKNKGYIKHIFAVILPKERSYIHLDMIFTMIDHNLAVIHEPIVLGNEKLGVIHMEIGDGPTKFHRPANLLAGLRDVGIDLDPVNCGGNSSLRQEREQWMAGANFFTLAPGKIIGYGRNTETFFQLEKAGLKRLSAKEILDGKVKLSDYEKYAISISGAELSRGGGGARCMTLPVLRDNI